MHNNKNELSEVLENIIGQLQNVREIIKYPNKDFELMDSNITELLRF